MREMPQCGLDLLDSFENCELTAYRDGGRVLTIGWGHTGADVYEGLTITQDQADELQEGDLRAACAAVENLVTSNLNDNQYAALVDFVYNVGQGNFSGSTMRRLLNSGNFDVAAQEFPKWDHEDGKPSAGLLRRRKAEQTLFLTPMDA